MERVLKKISGNQVYLSQPSIEDTSEFLANVKESQDLHSPWVQAPSDECKYGDYIKRIQNANQKGFFIRLNTTDNLVGVINISEIVMGCFQSAYLGFYAFSGHAGKGFMSEGLGLVIGHAFNDLGLHRLEANIQRNNIKSISLIRRHRFRHEGVSLRYLKINNEWRDHERFAITIEENNNN